MLAAASIPLVLYFTTRLNWQKLGRTLPSVCRSLYMTITPYEPGTVEGVMVRPIVSIPDGPPGTTVPVTPVGSDPSEA